MITKDRSRSEPIRAGALLAAAKPRLQAAGLEPREAEDLLMHAAAMDRAGLIRDDPRLGPAARRRFEEALRRRCAREPMAYITGSVDFLGLRLAVASGVLVPRPETELWLASWLDGREATPARILDLGTGSGCLALALARRYPGAFVVAVDRSVAALDQARTNAASNGIDNVLWLGADLDAAFGGGAVFDMIVSNPPYVSEGDYAGLEPEVNRYEPPEALLAGPDGLQYYRRLAPALASYLAPDGVFALEIGSGQGGPVLDLLRAAGLCALRVRPDLAGHDRMVEGRKGKA